MKTEILFRKGLIGFKKKDVYNYFSTYNEDVRNEIEERDNTIDAMKKDMEELQSKVNFAVQKALLFKNEAKQLKEENITLGQKMIKREKEFAAIINKIKQLDLEKAINDESMLKNKDKTTESVNFYEQASNSIIAENSLEQKPQIAPYTAQPEKQTANPYKEEKNVSVNSSVSAFLPENEEKQLLLTRINDLKEQLTCKEEEFYNKKQEYLAIIMQQTEQKKLADEKIIELMQKQN